MPRASGNTRVPNDPPSDPDTPDEDILIGDLIDHEDDSDYPVGPDELGFWLIWFINQRALYNHALSVIGIISIGVISIGIICAHLPLAQG